MTDRLQRSPSPWRILGRKLLERVDSESVRPFQAIVYLAFSIGGMYMLAFGGEPTAVNEAMGQGMHYAWISLLVLGPALVWAGFLVEDKHVGLWFQLGGNASICFALLAFVLAMLEMYYLSAAVFTVSMSIALLICTLILMLRDIRRLRLVEEVAKELERRSE